MGLRSMGVKDNLCLPLKRTSLLDHPLDVTAQNEVSESQRAITIFLVTVDPFAVTR
jgi:hypothetical protein